MSAFVWCELVCRVCAKTTAGRFTSGAIPRRSMCNEAVRAGWRRHPDDPDDWICEEQDKYHRTEGTS